ncbi:glucose 1-dehydrogenase [Corynebacterium hylobatis]|uniref:Glucose 1-dehydrogenase n=1 Tax=Corynebacterium hylobatis TaxID=1859290 RepID=A0A3S0B609_9CORY|nr:glucose 1-dehydrogenase [Corynebacterium hylobatis]RSZ65626.1 glucose 1-dehydrogenase [Corynebacterium hylobatis]
MTDKNDFNGKVALVTGAAQGLGAGIAKDLAARGASVIVADLNQEGAENVATEIEQAGGKAAAMKMDSASREDNRKAVELAVEKFGALHLAVNNAGINGPGAPVGEMDLDKWDRVIDINLNGVAYGNRYQIEQFLKQGDGNYAIVNMSSIHGSVAILDNAAYTASKHAVIGLTKNVAAEYGKNGIRVNAVGPAYIRTPLMDTLTEEVQGQLVSRHPLGRLGETPEVVALVNFLLSEEASFITGSYHLVDGGYTAV